MSLLVLHCFAQLAAEQIRYRAALICSLRAVLTNGWAQENFICDSKQRRQRVGGEQSWDPQCSPCAWGMQRRGCVLQQRRGPGLGDAWSYF